MTFQLQAVLLPTLQGISTPVSPVAIPVPLRGHPSRHLTCLKVGTSQKDFGCKAPIFPLQQRWSSVLSSGMPRRERVILSPDSTLLSPDSPSPQEGTAQQENGTGTQYPIHGHHTPCAHHLLFLTATCRAPQCPSVWQLTHPCSSPAALQPSPGPIGLPV